MPGSLNSLRYLAVIAGMMPSVIWKKAREKKNGAKMLRRNHVTPFQVEVKRQANKALGWPDHPPVLVYLNEAKREHLATRGGLKGPERDEEVHLARVIMDMIDKDMERQQAASETQLLARGSEAQ
jgi:hypothetical protein